jgi:hypothetical protein
MFAIMFAIMVAFPWPVVIFNNAFAFAFVRVIFNSFLG